MKSRIYKRIEELGEVVGGGTPSTNNEAYWNGDIPWISPKDLTSYNYRYISRGERNITKLGFENSSAKMLPKGSILFSSRAPIGYVAIAANSVCTNQGFKSVVPSKNVDPLFLYYLLKANGKHIANMGSGTTFKEVSGKVMRNIVLPIPSTIEEQKRISSILDSIDSKIELNNQINDYLAETAVALFNRECSQSNEPNAMLSDIAQITMGQSPSGSSYNEEGDGEVFYQGRAEFGAFFPRRRLFTTKPKRMAQEGDTLMSVRAPVGDLNIANENCCIGRGLAAIHSENNQSFVHYLVRAQRRILNTFNGDGTVFGSINGKALKELPVFLPGNDVIAHLESQLKSIDELIRRNDDEMQALEQMRDTLLPRLMSDEIDVSQIEVPKQLNNHLYGY